MLIPEEIRKCVVFVCYRDAAKKMQLAGTAFFVIVPVDDKYHQTLLVTAQHVLNKINRHSGDGETWVRVNLNEKPADFVRAPLSLWHIHPDDASIDVAVLPWSPPAEVDFKAVPVGMAATDEVINKETIGPGDEVFITGLFVNHFGKEKNIPIVRIGNIAAMPEEKVQTRMGPVDAFLIEARSIGGLSGSPVFVHLSGVRKGGLALGAKIYLLGLMHGHWDVEIKEHAIQKDQFEREHVNMGIGIVVPVQKIFETINQPELRLAREKEVAAARAAKKA